MLMRSDRSSLHSVMAIMIPSYNLNLTLCCAHRVIITIPTTTVQCQRLETLDQNLTYMKSPPHKLDGENASRMFQCPICKHYHRPHVVHRLQKSDHGPLEYASHTMMITPTANKH